MRTDRLTICIYPPRNQFEEVNPSRQSGNSEDEWFWA